MVICQADLGGCLLCNVTIAHSNATNSLMQNFNQKCCKTVSDVVVNESVVNHPAVMCFAFNILSKTDRNSINEFEVLYVARSDFALCI